MTGFVLPFMTGFAGPSPMACRIMGIELLMPEAGVTMLGRLWGATEIAYALLAHYRPVPGPRTEDAGAILASLGPPWSHTILGMARPALLVLPMDSWLFPGGACQLTGPLGDARAADT